MCLSKGVFKKIIYIVENILSDFLTQKRYFISKQKKTKRYFNV